MLPGFRSVPRNDAAALREAVGERTAAVLIEPIQGEAGRLPDQRRGAAGRPRGLRRVRRAADPRRDPDRDRADRLALGLPADPDPPGRADHRQGARRRPADRRLHRRPGRRRGARGRRSRLDLRRRPGRRRGGAGGARRRRRPGAAAQRARAGRPAARGPGGAGGCARGSRPRPDGRRRPRRRASTRTPSGPTCSERGLVVNVPAPDTLRLLPPLVVEPAQIDARDWPDRRIALGFVDL